MTMKPIIRGWAVDDFGDALATFAERLETMGSTGIFEYHHYSAFEVLISRVRPSYIVSVAVGSRWNEVGRCTLSDHTAEEIGRTFRLLDDDAETIADLLNAIGAAVEARRARRSVERAVSGDPAGRGQEHPDTALSNREEASHGA